LAHYNYLFFESCSLACWIAFSSLDGSKVVYFLTTKVPY
jgi:hypothetical protein